MRVAALLLVLAACPRGGDKPKPNEPVGSGSARVVVAPADADPAITLPPSPPLPAVPPGIPPISNPHVTPDAVAFGELLFHDPRLSAAGNRSCASCHDPAHGYSGGVETAADGKKNLRRTPTLVNLAWVKELGWDGRYPTVPDLLPPHVKGQLGGTIDDAVARIDAVPLYHAYIARIGVSPGDAVVQALEAFALTRQELDSPWDHQERTALSSPGAATDPVLAGYKLFAGKAQCGMCHAPPLYTDGGYHVVDVNTFGDPAHHGAFRTPTLRGAALRTKFFHQASAASLEEVVSHYVNADSHIANADPIITKIDLSADEQKQLVTFLKSLTADRPPPSKPVLP